MFEIVRFYVMPNKPMIVLTRWEKFVPAQQHICINYLIYCLPRYIGDGFKCKGMFDICHAIKLVMVAIG